jgi:hypothetical protein
MAVAASRAEGRGGAVMIFLTGSLDARPSVILVASWPRGPAYRVGGRGPRIGRSKVKKGHARQAIDFVVAFGATKKGHGAISVALNYERGPRKRATILEAFQTRHATWLPAASRSPHQGKPSFCASGAPHHRFCLPNLRVFTLNLPAPLERKPSHDYKSA